MSEPQNIKKALSRLLMEAPFFGNICLRFPVVYTDRVHVAATDGFNIFWNPAAESQYSIAELKMLWAHEAMHVFLRHPFRMAGRDYERANIAADYVVNLLLDEAGYTIPKDALIDNKYKGMCFEQVYELMKKQGESEKQIKASQMGGIEPAGKVGRDGAIVKARESEIAEIVSQAEACAKIAGSMPGNMSKVLHDLIYPTKDFASRLLEFAQETLSNEVVWHRPNRRYLPQGIWTPGRDNTNQINNLVVVIDTSGSITLEDMRAYAGAVEQVRDNLDIEKVTVLYCDTKVHEGGEYGIGEKITFEVKGGGGTNFDPPFHYIEKINLDPDLMIYFTDMYGNCTVTAPDFPVIWAVAHGASTFTPGFGIRIEL